MKHVLLLLIIIINTQYSHLYSQYTICYPTPCPGGPGSSGGGPGSGGSGGSGGGGTVPTAREQEEAIKKRQADERKRRRAEEAARMEEIAKTSYQNRCVQMVEQVKKWEQYPAVKHIQESLDKYPRAKSYYQSVTKNLNDILTFEKQINGAKNSQEAKEINKKIEGSVIGYVINSNSAGAIVELAEKKTEIANNNYENANKRLLFAEKEKAKLLHMRQELIDKTTAATSEWIDAVAIISQGVRDAAALVQTHLGLLNPPAGKVISVSQAFIESLIESNVSGGGVSDKAMLEKAFKASAYQTLVSSNQLSYIPDRIKTTMDTMEKWKTLDKQQQDRRILRRQVSETMDMIDRSIKRMDKMILDSNEKVKGRIPPAIDKVVNKPVKSPTK